MQFIISETDDVLVSHSGLALAGVLLQGTPLVERLSAIEVEGSRRPAMPPLVATLVAVSCSSVAHGAGSIALSLVVFSAHSVTLRC
jgi:hypothetical protein